MLNTFAPETHQNEGYQHSLTSLETSKKVIVVGAGIFGCCTALFLQRKGFEVILFDAWGPGNSRSSSSDETRVIRSTYGANEIYFDLNVRSLALWKQFQQGWNTPVFFNTGVLWLCHDESSPIVQESVPYARKHGMPYDLLTQRDLINRFPLIRSDDVHHGYLDPFGGYLKARAACQHLLRNFQEEGGHYIQSHVTPTATSTTLKYISDTNGTSHHADLFIFACGSWLGKIFPDVLGELITCTKQEVYYFGVPHNYAREFGQLPVWVDVDGKDFYYGIPSHESRGFKVGVDRRGIAFDPTYGDRIPDAAVYAHAREFLAHRFPLLGDAPLLENRVCPYENSPDGNFIVDMHPHLSNVVVVGGGSGHGFKHGPALGELIAEALAESRKLPSIFSLKRFKQWG